MKSLWDDTEASQFGGDLLQLRVYTSRLIGQESDLVLHGGGNTSVKATAPNIFGEIQEVLYVKGSGWDLASIEKRGFPAVRLQFLQRMVEIEQLNDTDMVRSIKSAMMDPGAPTPSVEAILHAIIPFTFVDHTHADAVVTITNTKNGEARIREIYGDKMLIIPYVMPGFILAKTVHTMTRSTNWNQLDGIILLNHGIFTFDHNAKECYERMIKSVTMAQAYLEKNTTISVPTHNPQPEDLNQLSRIRQAITKCKGGPMVAKLDETEEAVRFSSLPNVLSIARRGPLTPDHVIRTKRIPVVLSTDVEEDIGGFSKAYTDYFNRHGTSNLKALDPAPRWAVWPGHGIIAFGERIQDTEIILEIGKHTFRAIQLAESLDAWTVLSEKDIFDVEYWELEQAKINRGQAVPGLQGKIALVTGAASGIGQACVKKLCQEGAVVAALDIRSEINHLFNQSEILGLQCDVRNCDALERCVKATIRSFGGLDILVSNVGIFPKSQSISELSETNWNQSLDINLSSHQRLLKQCIPYLSLGIGAAIIIVGSKNAPAPGPGAAAYSVAKAGLTQLGRVAALELGELGIRVNVIHPNAVFDTGLWTNDLICERAKHYGIKADAYKRQNVLKVEITSKDVAAMVCTLAGSVFAKTTGAQIPIDGGNDRVI